jgi:hypothetical protein
MHLSQMVLVLENVAIPPADLALLAHPNLIGHLADQTEVVAHKYNATFKLIQCLGQRIDRFDIQVILQHAWASVNLSSHPKLHA